MKYWRIGFCLGMLFLLPACQEEPKFLIQFCESIDPEKGCLGSNDTFPVNTRVYVRFTWNTEINSSFVSGKIYERNSETDETYLGGQQFILEKGQNKIDYYLPFDNFGTTGTYYVRFFNQMDSLLVEKPVTIAE